MKYKEKKAFTLIEIMVGVLIVSIVLIGALNLYNNILIGKSKIVAVGEIQKRAFYFSEKLFEEIKKGGLIDYEEYFNRKRVGTGTLNGHYKKLSKFGNKVGSLYECHTSGTGGCQSGTHQMYGQYALQTISYNDPGEDDDEDTGEGPVAFNGNKVKEIYLISGDGKTRTFFRWKIQNDPADATSCDPVFGGVGCKSTIEFLKLNGKDWGENHKKDPVPLVGQYDGVVDTWTVDPRFGGLDSVIIPAAGMNGMWQPLFSDNINVKNVKFFLYPNKDANLSWKSATETDNIAPYIRIQMTLAPTFKSRLKMKGKKIEVKINTTIALTDIYSQ